MKGKAFVPIRLGRPTRPAWLRRFGSGRFVVFGLALSLLLLGLSGLLVFLRQPHLLQGDGRWEEAQALFWPAELGAGLAAGLLGLLLLNAIWPALAGLVRWVRYGLNAALASALRGVDAGLLRPIRWAVSRLRAALRVVGAGLRWVGAALIQPAGRSVSIWLRLLGGIVDRVLVKGAWLAIRHGLIIGTGLLTRGARALVQLAHGHLARPIQMARVRLAGALRWIGTQSQGLLRSMARLVLLPVAALFRLVSATGRVLGQALRWLDLAARPVVRLVARVAVTLSRLTSAAGRGLGQAVRFTGLAAHTVARLLLIPVAALFRLVSATGRVLGHALRWLDLAARPVVRLVALAAVSLSRLMAAAGRGLGQTVRFTGLAVRPIWSAVGAGLSAGLALLSWADRGVRHWSRQAVGGLRAVAAGVRAWHASLSEAQALVVLGTTTLFFLSAGWRITADLFPNGSAGEAPAVALAIIFAPGVALGLVLGRKLQLALWQARVRALARVTRAAASLGRRPQLWKFAVAGGALAILGSCQPPLPAVPCTSSKAEAVEVCIYSANTKEDWLNAVTEAFNAAQIKTTAGKPIVVYPFHVTSGASREDILSGKIQPTVWSPGDQSWADGANLVWQERHGQPLIPETCQATVYAPVGFAMWRDFAEVLGWPDEPIGWDTLVALAADPEGWGRYGHPEWGAFKFGHTHPDYSNSGLLVLTALAYSTFDRTDGLTPELVESQPFVDALRTVELNTYHYGRQSRDLLALMARRGPEYLHAINTTEAETLKTNQEQAATLRFPLVFIFPAEGTFWTEQPYCVLDAEWVSADQREAARLFEAYLHEPAQQALAVNYNVRPEDLTIPLGERFTLANGTDPRVTPQTLAALASPSGEVADAVKRVFHATKKSATILLVLDTSGSMAGEKLTNARDATANFIGRLAANDEVAVMVFNDTVIDLEPAGLAGEIAGPLSEVVRQQQAGGGTALYDAVCTVVQRMAQWQAEDIAAGERRLYGIVVLSDGVNTAGDRQESDMLQCLPSGDEVEGIKVFTIAYGEDADQELLAEIARHTNGKAFTGDPATIEQIYLAISAEQ